jgi:hypothetical protein
MSCVGHRRGELRILFQPPKACRSPFGSARNGGAVRRKGQGRHGFTMHLHRLQQLSALEIPKFDPSIRPAARHSSPDGIDRQGSDFPGFPGSEHPIVVHQRVLEEDTRFNLPTSNLAVLRAGDEKTSIIRGGRKGHPSLRILRGQGGAKFGPRPAMGVIVGSTPSTRLKAVPKGVITCRRVGRLRNGTKISGSERGIPVRASQRRASPPHVSVRMLSRSPVSSKIARQTGAGCFTESDPEGFEATRNSEGTT